MTSRVLLATALMLVSAGPTFAQSISLSLRDGRVTLITQNGAESSRLSFASDMLSTNKNNLEAANSRIVDVDVAEESTKLARNNILVQAGTAMLSQANSSAQSALRLLN